MLQEVTNTVKVHHISVKYRNTPRYVITIKSGQSHDGLVLLYSCDSRLHDSGSDHITQSKSATLNGKNKPVKVPGGKQTCTHTRKSSILISLWSPPAIVLEMRILHRQTVSLNTAQTNWEFDSSTNKLGLPYPLIINFIVQSTSPFLICLSRWVTNVHHVKDEVNHQPVQISQNKMDYLSLKTKTKTINSKWKQNCPNIKKKTDNIK